MIELGNRNPEVCVIGRCNFATGMGAITYAFCELLSRSFSVCLLPTEKSLRHLRSMELPSGRIIPIYSNSDSIKASIFTDVLWNGTSDFNYALTPQSGLRIAYPCFDSDEAPGRWVEILNSEFDIAAVASPHLEDILRLSGVEIPIATLPLAIDIDRLLVAHSRPNHKPFRIGSISAFHRRKGTEILLEAFASAFGGNSNVELVVHSNLVFPEFLQRLQSRVKSLDLPNVIISTTPLTVQQKNEMLASFDLYANLSVGEGFSIGPREALALGTPAVLSDVGGHRHLGGVPGVFLVPATRKIPARYPEIDNVVAGHQYVTAVADVAKNLQEAFQWAQSPERRQTEADRRRLAANFSFQQLAGNYAELIKPELLSRRSGQRTSKFSNQPSEAKKVAQQRTSHAGSWNNRHGLIVQAHDGGFFSLFNSFFSNMVWDLREERVHSILPDWDVGRFMERHRGRAIMSFCYGQPEDGNIWTKLFQPLYGLSQQEMNNEAVLYNGASVVADTFNGRREPLLTYKHAYRLYRSPFFQKMRNQYSRVFHEKIILVPRLQSQIDDFTKKNFFRAYMIAAHVRHPSHTVEQPESKIAHAESYINRIRDLVRLRGYSEESPEWGVFLATDQDRVITRFREVFGDRVSYFENVRRTTVSEDELFDALSTEDKNKDGHQLQHLVASNGQNWSLQMAEEVICDAVVMAKCDALLHVVSNVSTAVAYMNPSLEMIYCDS